LRRFTRQCTAGCLKKAQMLDIPFVEKQSVKNSKSLYNNLVVVEAAKLKREIPPRCHLVNKKAANIYVLDLYDFDAC
jgi:hypothetical protein